MSGSGDYQTLNDCFDVDDNSVGILIVVSILLMIFIIYQRTTLKAFSSKQLTAVFNTFLMHGGQNGRSKWEVEMGGRNGGRNGERNGGRNECRNGCANFTIYVYRGRFAPPSN